jgi:UPF0716 protein FxsA
VTAGPAPRPRRTRLRWWLAALVLMAMVEVVVLVAVGRSIGLLWTLTLLVGMAVLGAWLARRETGRTLRGLQRAVESGRMPADEVTDAILVVMGGFLLVLPGFLSDVAGLLLVVPLTRPAARRLLQALVAQQALRVRAGAAAGPGGRPEPRPGRGEVIEGEIVAEEPPPGSRPGQGPTPLDL